MLFIFNKQINNAENTTLQKLETQKTSNYTGTGTRDI